MCVSGAAEIVSDQRKKIPQRAADLIVGHCAIENIDWDELRKQTELIGYPVLGVVKQIVNGVNEIEPGLGEWTHWYQSRWDEFG